MVMTADRTAQAAERWQGVTIDHDTFSEYCVEVMAAGSDIEALTDETLAELYLACGCSRGDAAAVMHFDAHYLSLVPAALAHMRLSADMVDEVRQQVRHKLLVADTGQRPRVDRYAGQGKLRGLIQVIAVRSALSLLRKDSKLAPDGEEQLLAMPSPEHDPELAFLKQRYRAVFKQAFEQAVRGLSSRDRNFLRLHHFGGLTVEAVGKVYGVHRATATRWLARLREQLLRDTERGLQAALSVSDDELESLMQLVQSRLDVSMQRILETMDGTEA